MHLRGRRSARRGGQVDTGVGGEPGAFDGPGGGASAGGAVAVPVAPPAPAAGEPSAEGALEESVPVSARAMLSPCPVVTSTPTPSATASAPTRPMYLLEPLGNVPGDGTVTKCCGAMLTVGHVGCAGRAPRGLRW